MKTGKAYPNRAQKIRRSLQQIAQLTRRARQLTRPLLLQPEMIRIEAREPIRFMNVR